MSGNKNTERELGYQAAMLEHHQESITELKLRRDQDAQRLQLAIDEFKASNAEYLREIWKTRWTRRGALAVITFLTLWAGWVLKYDPGLAQRVLTWLINLTSQTH